MPTYKIERSCNNPDHQEIPTFLFSDGEDPYDAVRNAIKQHSCGCKVERWEIFVTVLPKTLRTNLNINLGLSNNVTSLFDNSHIFEEE